MKIDFIIYNGEVFKTGDSISCKINGSFIPDAKIYVCSEAEIMEIWGHNRVWLGVMFVYNNFYDNHLGESPYPGGFGYEKAFTAALIKKFEGNVWSDHVTDVQHKIKIKDELKNLIDVMVSRDKLAIEKGVINI